MNILDINGITIAEFPADGPKLSSERDATDMLGDLYGLGIDMIALPVTRMAPEFWVLKTTLAGHFIQKLQNYQCRVAFIGDLTQQVGASDALRDYILESNRRKDVLFARDMAELGGML